jgi:hypothetical protein
MSGTFEEQLDLALEQRRQRRRQHEAEHAQSDQSIRDVHAELEHKQTMFCTEVRSLIENAVAKANRHLARRPERCQFSEVSGYFTGPWYPGSSACNPIAYELRIDDREVGETLIIELRHDGMVEASLGPFRPHVSEGHTTRSHFGWPSISLDRFDANTADDLVLRYIIAITERWPLGQKSSDVGLT